MFSVVVVVEDADEAPCADDEASSFFWQPAVRRRASTSADRESVFMGGAEPSTRLTFDLAAALWHRAALPRARFALPVVLTMFATATACSPDASRGHPRAAAATTTASASPPSHPDDAGVITAEVKSADETPLRELPYSPSLDVSSLDRSVDPCVDLYAFACGGWQKNNPIPPDQSSWSVYRKLTNEVRRHLWGLLKEESELETHRSAVHQQLGDYFAACMDEAAIDAKGASPLAPALAALDAVTDVKALSKWFAEGAFDGGASKIFWVGSEQDSEDASKYIPTLRTRGLGLPDRDDYLATSAKAVELRERYHAYIEKLHELLGDDKAKATKGADLVLRIETELAKVTLDRVERRDPHKMFHPMSLAKLQALAPAIEWKAVFDAVGIKQTSRIDVTQPKFFERASAMLREEPLDVWKTWLRIKLVAQSAHLLSKPFVDEEFAFNGKYLRGAQSLRPRWKRCVEYTSDDLSEALAQLFVERNFAPDLKARAEKVLSGLQKAMEQEIDGLTWMSPPTKAQARAKLKAMINKIGYPAKYRDYSSIKVQRGDFHGNAARAWRFERARQIARIGKPIDRSEWEVPPQEVDATYNPRKNDMNFPAAILLPPLFDAKMDDAPNYGNTGGCMGHELIHGFDDQGRKFDAQGNLRDWWTKPDAIEIEKRAKCVSDQYSAYVVIDDIHLNGKLTLGEDLADLGGLVLAYKAWTAAYAAEKKSSGASDPKRDGFTPEQRFFLGYAQWDCANIRPETLRLRARTDEHSPPRFRINGVVTNMPEFARAFSCQPGQPMVKPASDVCVVW